MKDTTKRLVLVKNRLFSQLSEKTLESRSLDKPVDSQQKSIYDQLVKARKLEIKQLLLKRDIGVFRKTKTLPVIYYRLVSEKKDLQL